MSSDRSRRSSTITTPAFDPSGNLIGVVEILRSTTDRPSNAEMAVHGLAARLVGILSDRHQFESILANAANQDSLTGLGNRRLLAQVLADHEAARRSFAVYAIDLDQFTWINNNLGHLAGDQLLAGVAKRFLSVLPDDAQAFRPGGDEFAVVWTGDLDPTTVMAVGRRLVDSLAEPFNVGPVKRRVRASIGIATRGR
ncbi:MAG: GGDEF domain-containing protein [Acidimicrobiales bacterium]